MFQAKDAIKQVVAAQNGKVHFGIATFNVLNAIKKITPPPATRGSLPTMLP